MTTIASPTFEEIVQELTWEEADSGEYWYELLTTDGKVCSLAQGLLTRGVTFEIHRSVEVNRVRRANDAKTYTFYACKLSRGDRLTVTLELSIS